MERSFSGISTMTQSSRYSSYEYNLDRIIKIMYANASSETIIPNHSQGTPMQCNEETKSSILPSGDVSALRRQIS